MKYSIGQKVKIISLEKFRSYPKVFGDDCYQVGSFVYHPAMKKYCGTEQIIREVYDSCYYLMIDAPELAFSPEMISGPADTPDTPETDNYAEKLERFVLAVAAGQEMPVNKVNDKSHAKGIVEYAVELLAAFDEEIKKHRI